ncbi:hypothetical protein [Azospirillum sp.]|uniref:hypothetical protein n=1 Tax=Azospirillum sp. TaxID=34012 RepID=UPI002D609DE5|nr:hypothetical protein [Azospirillum sp.]HYD66332.1 hypothetical protein [Azospirillum sp.]
MGVAIPNASSMNWFQLTGKTSELSPRGNSADYRTFTVDKPGEFNFKVNNSYTTVRIMNDRNEVVAEAKSGQDIAQASAKLGPGTYTALIEQQMRGVNNRDYALEISHRNNAMVLSSGGTLKGVARETFANDPGVQKHTLNVVQGGEFSLDFSLPYSRWAIMGKDNKVVASGDTMKPEAAVNDILKKRSYKIEPGQYEVVIVPPKKVIGEIPFQLTMVPKTASVDMPAEERPIDKIFREREARLQQWAAKDAAKSSSTKKTA